MTKSMMLLSLIFLLSPLLANAQGFKGNFECKISSITGNFGSYVPPKKGDTLRVSASTNSLKDLIFSSSAVIPVQGKFVRQPQGKDEQHFVTFRSEFTTPLGGLDSVVFMIGKFGDPSTGRYEVTAVIQKLFRQKANYLFAMNEAKLTCREI
jgi:hypothetical protein